MKSLLKQADYSQDWVKDFYTQSAIWWGRDPQAAGTHAERLTQVERAVRVIDLIEGPVPDPRRILDLGCGPGLSAAALADAGYAVTGVELNPTDAAYARELLKTPRPGALTFLEADFYTVDLPGPFDVVVCWQIFGIGSDADQRRLLRRISREWLAPGGKVLLDVYHPAGPMRDNGREWHLQPLKGCPARSK